VTKDMSELVRIDLEKMGDLSRKGPNISGMTALLTCFCFCCLSLEPSIGLNTASFPEDKSSFLDYIGKGLTSVILSDTDLVSK
jgi:hypothetical protein